jgi:hypothetical protein
MPCRRSRSKAKPHSRLHKIERAGSGLAFLHLDIHRDCGEIKELEDDWVV